MHYHENLPWADGQIITAQEYLLNAACSMQHQAFVFRRIYNPVCYLNRYYEDTTVSLYHLQYGNVGVIREEGYVYIENPQGINQSVKGDDGLVIYNLLPFLHIVLFPQFEEWILKGEYNKINKLIKETLKRRIVMSPNGIKYIKSIPIPIFQLYASIALHQFSVTIYIRLIVVRFLLLLNRLLGKTRFINHIVYRLVNKNTPRK